MCQEAVSPGWRFCSFEVQMESWGTSAVNVRISLSQKKVGTDHLFIFCNSSILVIQSLSWVKLTSWHISGFIIRVISGHLIHCLDSCHWDSDDYISDPDRKLLYRLYARRIRRRNKMKEGVSVSSNQFSPSCQANTGWESSLPSIFVVCNLSEIKFLNYSWDNLSLLLILLGYVMWSMSQVNCNEWRTTRLQKTIFSQNFSLLSAASPLTPCVLYPRSQWAVQASH